MGNQTAQRQNLAQQAAEACKELIDVLARLEVMADRRPYLGNFVAEDFVGLLAYLDAGTVGTLFDLVIPNLLANFDDAANGGRNKQITHQLAASL